MKVNIDGIIFSLQRQGGISVYFWELLNQLAESKVDYTLNFEEPVCQDITEVVDESYIRLRQSRPLERYRKCRIDSDCKLFHSSYYRSPTRSSVLTVVTVHDFTYERYRSGLAKWAHVWQKHSAIRQAQAVICISDSTRDDLLEFVGMRSNQSLHVIPNGVSRNFVPLNIGPASRPYVLFVGDRRGYKNFRLVMHALEFMPEIELRCVGGGAFSDQELSVSNESVRKRIQHCGFVSETELNQLYNQAICLIYPSKYEGFGIPVAEAMRAGCPVVSINCKAVVEVGGEALVLAQDDDPRSVAESVHQLLEPEFRQLKVSQGILRAGRYDWKLCHEQTINVYKTLIDINQ